MKTMWLDPIDAQIVPIPKEEQMSLTEGAGHLEELIYDTWESDTYESHEKALKKRAIVYVPAEMPKEGKLDVVFLMHGGWSDETIILGTPGQETELKNAIDHCMAQKRMRPMLLVCPTYNNLTPKDNWDYGLAIRLTRQYPRELVNDLLPAIARKYPTFAKSDQKEDLQAARKHFAYGGFSMGSVSTWQVFVQAMAWFGTFFPSSGNFGVSGSEMVRLVRKQGFGARDFFLLAMTGTKDFAAEAFAWQLQNMVNEGSVFIYTEDGLSGNTAFRVADGYEHNREAMLDYFYNDLKWYGQMQEVEDTNIFTKATTISQVRRDPAFSGFSRLLFPVQQGYMSGTTLGTLDFAWYSEVNGDTSVDVLNTMKQSVLAGNQIFYPIYSDQEIARDPSKENTGLFFFRGEPGAPTAIVSAGGGFAYVAALHDSFPVCMELSRMGINAFSMIYRPGAQTACEDLSRAIAFLFEHAKELQIDMSGYSLWGGSAGARMSAWVSEMTTAAFGQKVCPKPAADIIQYTGLGEASRQDVPTYMIVGTRDSIAWYKTMEARAAALRRLGIDSTCRVVEGLRHGFGLGIGTKAEGWVKEALDFWLKQRRKDGDPAM